MSRRRGQGVGVTNVRDHRGAGVLAGVLMAVLVLLPAGVVTAGPASAHNVLVSTSPADGSTVAALPDQVRLTFNLPAIALGSAVQIVGPSGNVAVGSPALVNTDVTEQVAAGSPAGKYTVEWHVTSADGHPIDGEFSFTATAGGGSAARVTAASTPVATASTTGTSSGSGGPQAALWIALGVVLVILIGLGVVMSRRRPAGQTPG